MFRSARQITNFDVLLLILNLNFEQHTLTCFIFRLICEPYHQMYVQAYIISRQVVLQALHPVNSICIYVFQRHLMIRFTYSRVAKPQIFRLNRDVAKHIDMYYFHTNSYNTDILCENYPIQFLFTESPRVRNLLCLFYIE